MIKGLIAATATALLTVAALTAADHVDAHTPQVYDDCDGLHVTLRSYESKHGPLDNNTVTVTIDGQTQTFGFDSGFQRDFDWDDTVEHVWSVSIDANIHRGDPTRWDRTFTGKQQPCQQPTTTSTTSTTSTTTTTTTVAPTSTSSTSTTTPTPSTTNPSSTSTSVATTTAPTTSTSTSTSSPSTTSPATTSTTIPASTTSSTPETSAPPATSVTTTGATIPPATGPTSSLPWSGPLPATGDNARLLGVGAIALILLGGAALFIVRRPQ